MRRTPFARLGVSDLPAYRAMVALPASTVSASTHGTCLPLAVLSVNARIMLARCMQVSSPPAAVVGGGPAYMAVDVEVTLLQTLQVAGLVAAYNGPALLNAPAGAPPLSLPAPPVADLQTTAAWMLSTCPVGGAANLRVAGSDTHTVPAGPTAAERVDGEPGQSHAAPRGCRCNTDLRHSWCAAARRRCYVRGTGSRRSSRGSFSSPVRRDASQQARVADASVRTRSSSRADFRVVE